MVSYPKSKHKFSMQDPSTMDYKTFKDTFIESLKKHAPLKRKSLRANYSNFITKELIKAIMQRSKLCNLYLEVRSDENRIRYKKQRKIFVSHYLEKLKESTTKILVKQMLLTIGRLGKE